MKERKQTNHNPTKMFILIIFTHRLGEMADITRTNNRLKENIDTKDEKIVSLERRSVLFQSDSILLVRG